MGEESIKLKPGETGSTPFSIFNDAPCSATFDFVSFGCTEGVTLQLPEKMVISSGGSHLGTLHATAAEGTDAGRYDCYVVVGKGGSECAPTNLEYETHDVTVIVEKWVIAKT